jgi:hypothetical protein
MTTNSAGVIYGATGVPHTGFAGPGLPHHAGRGTIDDRQSTVVARNISDVRSVLPVMSYTATTGTSFSVNCNGADRVIVHIGAITASITLTLNNLQVGIPVQIVVSNSSGGTLIFKVAANTPSGLAYTCHQRSRVLLEALQTLPP